MEIWSKGRLLFQRTLQKCVRAWNISRENNSVIFLLDQEDERCDQTFIHIVSLKQACEFSHNMAMVSEHLDCIEEKKIIDWTGLCSDEESVKKMNFALDRSNVLYVSTPETLHAASLDDLVPANKDDLSINGAAGAQEVCADVMSFGKNTRLG